MGSVTHVDFQAAREKAPAAPAADFANSTEIWADAVAAWWYSPTGRFVAFSCTLGIILTGLGIAVFAAAAMIGVLG